MIEAALASCGCSYLLLSYLGMMETLFSRIDEITELHDEEVHKEIKEILNDLKRLESKYKKREK